MLECVNGLSLNSVMMDGMLLGGVFGTAKAVFLILIGFSLVIFMHELGHFLMAKLAGVRVEKFAVGFGKTIFSFRKGIGVRFGSTLDAYQRRLEEYIAAKRGRESQSDGKLAPTESELAAAAQELGLGETEYAFNGLPIGGYVKMMGQEDFAVDKSGEWKIKTHPRSFMSKPVGKRMLIVSAGVVMNMIFAALLFTIVFMCGFDVPTPVIGEPLPGTPAEKAGLQFGDRILSIDGKEINDYDDIRMAVVLAEPHEPLHMKVLRDGRIIECSVTPEYDPDRSLLQIGVPPKFTRVISAVEPEPGPPQPDALQPGDEVIEANGKPVRDFFDIYHQLQAARGAPVSLVVLRPDPKDRSRKIRVTCTRRAWVQFAKTGDGPYDVGHLLGFVPRRRVLSVTPGGSADVHGIRAGDVIADWATIKAPTWKEIATSVQNNPGVDLDVVLKRDDTSVQTYVRPVRPDFWGRGRPQVGFELGEEQAPVVVSDIVDRVEDEPTPASALRALMPRGSVITKVNGQPVKSWDGLTDQFFSHAGQTVQLSWRYEKEPERTHAFRVPNDVETLAGMPPLGRIVDINGQDLIEVTEPDGKVVPYSVHYWKGAYEILKRCLKDHPAEKVKVQYRDILDSAAGLVTKEVEITPASLDPWTMRIQFNDYVMANIATTRVQTWNPVKALWIGIGKTADFVVQTYETMRRMIFTRSVGVENMAGPVGIFQIGISIAESGMTRLLFFLGFLSANLAVINFLPLPIVDGGLMVFLLIEKIKGTPVSVKIQVVTQVIGLALLIAAFVFVTFMDISKL
jgi:membrane-associated protease RseP (regulator of RpoE activity)